MMCSRTLTVFVLNYRQQWFERTRGRGRRQRRPWRKGVLRQAADPTGERQPTSTAGRGVLPESANVVCGQQRTDGDITLRAYEEVGEPEREESGQGETV